MGLSSRSESSPGADGSVGVARIVVVNPRALAGVHPPGEASMNLGRTAGAAGSLVEGETGAGKERIAAELHRLSGRRGPLVVVNCAALSASVVESRLFRHVRGAFTGATRCPPGRASPRCADCAGIS